MLEARPNKNNKEKVILVVKCFYSTNEPYGHPSAVRRRSRGFPTLSLLVTEAQGCHPALQEMEPSSQVSQALVGNQTHLQSSPVSLGSPADPCVPPSLPMCPLAARGGVAQPAAGDGMSVGAA